MIKLKNSEKAIKRLVLALKNSEKIGVWSDYDPDGVFALVLAYESLLGANFKKENLKLILPDQYKYKRSFNKFHLSLLKRMGIKLIIGIDFGTTDFEQVGMAKKMGFEIILLDHHRQRPGKLPALLINPWQRGDKSKCKNWSGASVVYLFLEHLYKKLRINIKKLEENSIDLILIPFITDYIDKDGGINDVNLPYLQKSLEKIKKNPRLGIKKTLIRLNIYKNISIKVIVKNRRAIIDFFGTMKGNGTKNNVFKLLTVKTNKEIARIINKIIREKKIFTSIADKLTNQAITKFESNCNKNKFIFWGTNKEIKMPGAGANVTQKINDHFKLPTYFYNKEKNLIRGSARASYSKDVNVVESMKNCANSFINFGGHPKAAGFYIKKKNLPKLKQCLEKYYEEH